MDVRTFTVGPVQENCHIARLDGAAAGDRDRPGRRGRAPARGDRRARVEVAAILLTHTHFDHVGAVAPVARATGAEVWCPELEVAVLADIMRFVPWPGFGPFESYDADHTVAGGERLELAGMEIDVLFTPGHSPGPRDLLDPGRAGGLLRRRPVRRARSAAPTCRAATRRR